MEESEDFENNSFQTFDNLNLRPVCDIPGKYQYVFSEYPYFNAMQSKVLDKLLETDEPVVISAPTGSGKTVVFELAIIRLLQQIESDNQYKDYKVVYMAPVKALCTERYNDWVNKFGPLGVRCLEVTGDSDLLTLYNIQNYQLILTTPEKWDSMTRRWKDHISAVQLIKLFLIDEVHLLNEDRRGPTLEAVVSRMKTVQSSIKSSKGGHTLRFIAVSATIPNVIDVAMWLGNHGQPAHYEKIGEEMRPVKLNKIVLGYPYNESKTSYYFDMSLSYHIPKIIFKYSDGKPTLIFCSTRKGVQYTSSILIKQVRCQFSEAEKLYLQEVVMSLSDRKLGEHIMCGIGNHHAGISASDRSIIENLFREGRLPVLVTTSTLAMGVNLPAHLVIIKSTDQFVQNTVRPYPEAQILQMIGRAGRPQYDTSATAVIMTRHAYKMKYENLVAGKQLIESSLHRHLAEHLNSEVVLRTITDVAVAVDWIRSTFFYVRAFHNPFYYGLPRGLSKEVFESKLQDMCLRELNGLSKYNLIQMNEGYDVISTNEGQLMARYYLSFGTMKIFMQQVKGTEKLPELLDVISQSNEFSEVRLRILEKQTLNALNSRKKGDTIRYPIKGRIKTKEQKVNCLIQASLGFLQISDPALNQEATHIMRNATRICKGLAAFAWQRPFYKCLVSALQLSKALECNMWENSPYIAYQLHGIGPALSTQLVMAGKTTFKSILDSNPRDLEKIVNRHPPFGNNLQQSILRLPDYKLLLNVSDRQHLQVTLRLNNYQYIEENGDPNHRLSLIVGGNNNRILHKEKLTDERLVMKDGIYIFSLFLDSYQNLSDIEACVISEEYVGIDITAKFNFGQTDENFVQNNGPQKVHQTPIDMYMKKRKKITPKKKLNNQKISPKRNEQFQLVKNSSNKRPSSTSLLKYLYDPLKEAKKLKTIDENHHLSDEDNEQIVSSTCDFIDLSSNPNESFTMYGRNKTFTSDKNMFNFDSTNNMPSSSKLPEHMFVNTNEELSSTNSDMPNHYIFKNNIAYTNFYRDPSEYNTNEDASNLYTNNYQNSRNLTPRKVHFTDSRTITPRNISENLDVHDHFKLNDEQKTMLKDLFNLPKINDNDNVTNSNESVNIIPQLCKEYEEHSQINVINNANHNTENSYEKQIFDNICNELTKKQDPKILNKQLKDKSSSNSNKNKLNTKTIPDYLAKMFKKNRDKIQTKSSISDYESDSSNQSADGKISSSTQISAIEECNSRDSIDILEPIDLNKSDNITSNQMYKCKEILVPKQRIYQHPSIKSLKSFTSSISPPMKSLDNEDIDSEIIQSSQLTPIVVVPEDIITDKKPDINKKSNTNENHKELNGSNKKNSLLKQTKLFPLFIKNVESPSNETEDELTDNLTSSLKDFDKNTSTTIVEENIVDIKKDFDNDSSITTPENNSKDIQIDKNNNSEEDLVKDVLKTDLQSNMRISTHDIKTDEVKLKLEINDKVDTNMNEDVNKNTINPTIDIFEEFEKNKAQKVINNPCRTSDKIEVIKEDKMLNVLGNVKSKIHKNLNKGEIYDNKNIEDVAKHLLPKDSVKLSNRMTTVDKTFPGDYKHNEKQESVQKFDDGESKYEKSFGSGSSDAEFSDIDFILSNQIGNKSNISNGKQDRKQTGSYIAVEKMDFFSSDLGLDQECNSDSEVSSNMSTNCEIEINNKPIMNSIQNKYQELVKNKHVTFKDNNKQTNSNESYLKSIINYNNSTKKYDKNSVNNDSLYIRKDLIRSGKNDVENSLSPDTYSGDYKERIISYQHHLLSSSNTNIYNKNTKKYSGKSSSNQIKYDYETDNENTELNYNKSKFNENYRKKLGLPPLSSEEENELSKQLLESNKMIKQPKSIENGTKNNFVYTLPSNSSLVKDMPLIYNNKIENIDENFNKNNNQLELFEQSSESIHNDEIMKNHYSNYDISTIDEFSQNLNSENINETDDIYNYRENLQDVISKNYFVDHTLTNNYSINRETMSNDSHSNNFSNELQISKNDSRIGCMNSDLNDSHDYNFINRSKNVCHPQNFNQINQCGENSDDGLNPLLCVNNCFSNQDIQFNDNTNIHGNQFCRIGNSNHELSSHASQPIRKMVDYNYQEIHDNKSHIGNSRSVNIQSNIDRCNCQKCVPHQKFDRLNSSQCNTLDDSVANRIINSQRSTSITNLNCRMNNHINYNTSQCHNQNRNLNYESLNRSQSNIRNCNCHNCNSVTIHQNFHENNNNNNFQHHQSFDNDCACGNQNCYKFNTKLIKNEYTNPHEMINLNRTTDSIDNSMTQNCLHSRDSNILTCRSNNKIVNNNCLHNTIKSQLTCNCKPIANNCLHHNNSVCNDNIINEKVNICNCTDCKKVNISPYFLNDNNKINSPCNSTIIDNYGRCNQQIYDTNNIRMQQNKTCDCADVNCNRIILDDDVMMPDRREEMRCIKKDVPAESSEYLSALQLLRLKEMNNSSYSICDIKDSNSIDEFDTVNESQRDIFQ